VLTRVDRALAQAVRPCAPRQFHVSVKPIGGVCNLDCEYCFFLSKEMLYPGSSFRMAEDLLQRRLPKGRFTTPPSGESGQHYLCAGYQDFFHHVQAPMEAMTLRLRQHRAPSELMAGYARDDAARGRNEPCPCGSRATWRKCHGSRQVG